jgi:hypothetical protein
VIRVGLVVPGNGIPSRLPYRILKSQFNPEQMREIDRGKEQQQKDGHDEGNFQDGSSFCRCTPAPSTPHVTEAEFGISYASANSCRSRLLQLAWHTNW